MSDSKSDPFGGAGSNPANVLLSLFLFCLTGAMVARLPTEQEAVGSSPTLGFVYSLLVLVAQLADRPLHTRKAQGSIPCENSLSVFLFCFPPWCSR